MSECAFLNPLRRDGTSQRQRLVEPLAPSYAKVDERGTAELLLYARRYARLLRYYSPNNSAAGDWREFIDHDVSTVVALIADKDTDEIKEGFDEKRKAALDNGGSWDPATFSALLEEIAALAAFFDGWHRDAVKGLALYSALERLIGSVLNDALRTAISYSEGAKEAGLEVASFDSAGFGSIWELSDIEPDRSILPSGKLASLEEIEDAVTRTAAVFDRFFEALVSIVTNADSYFGQTLTGQVAHQPQMALILTFLLLFKRAQNHINTLTAEHLDFYYKEVLGLEHKAAKADLVHMVFELAKSFESHKLAEDTQLKAGKDSTGVELLFATDEELAVNRAKLDATHGLKTIFLDKSVSGVRNVHAATDADSADGKGAKIEDAEGGWETLGSTDMPSAKIGFALASPMFLLSEGDRRIIVKFVLRDKRRIFPDSAKRDLEHNVAVYASGEKQWLRLSVDKVALSADQPAVGLKRLRRVVRRPYIEFHLRLDASSDPIFAFDKEALAGAFVTKHPVLRFVFREDGLSSESLSAVGVPEREIDSLMDRKVVDFADAGNELMPGSLVRFAGRFYLARKEITWAGLLPPKYPGLWHEIKPDYPYKHFQGIEVAKLEITVEVGSVVEPVEGEPATLSRGARSLVLENDVGVLDPAKPFHPFGPVPRVGSSFLIGSHEVFSKPVEGLRLEIEWADLPQESFKTHYALYKRISGGIGPKPGGGSTTAGTGAVGTVAGTDAGGTIVGTGGVDTVVGTGGGTTIAGPGGGTIARAGGGDTIAETGGGTIAGLAGDTIPGTGGVGKIAGTGGLDTIKGTGALDTIKGTGGGGTTLENIVKSNGHFKAAFAVLDGGAWTELEGKALFDKAVGTRPLSKISIPLSPGLVRDARLEAFERYNTSLRRGFLKATLKLGFLHAMYPRLLAQAALAEAEDEIPNQPYTPLMASITLHYTAKQEVDYLALDKDDFTSRVENVFQIWPFGYREVFPIAADDEASGVPIDRGLVPDFSITVKKDDGGTETGQAEGSLLIGIDGLEPPQNLSLLFQVAEGSEDPDADAQTVVWSYLAENQEWADFKTAEILADGTNGLLTSGVVKLAAPKEMTASSTVLPKGCYWVKASVLEQTQALPDLIAVHPQAVVASFRDQNNDPARLAKPLAATTISKLKSRAAAVKTVSQPYASFGGRMKESDETYYTRVSERLRHKGRAVTIFDYERLVLEKFPEVYKVRCINHTRSGIPNTSGSAASGCEHCPGHVKLIVVPNLRNKNAVDPLRPRLSSNKLVTIREFLEEIASDFVSLEVANPVYEEIEVRFKVRLQPGRDKGLYETQLTADIVGFLSPWLYDDVADLTFGGRVHRSAILNFVEEREYVDFVTDFRMYHLSSLKDVEEAEASSSSAALVSAESHEVGFDVVSCVDSQR